MSKAASQSRFPPIADPAAGPRQSEAHRIYRRKTRVLISDRDTKSSTSEADSEAAPKTWQRGGGDSPIHQDLLISLFFSYFR